jgi:hypothetical protein
VYAYNYAVKDDYSLVNFAANEHRDGPDAAGSYRVALPDGRTQNVAYTAGVVSTAGSLLFPPRQAVTPASALT